MTDEAPLRARVAELSMVEGRRRFSAPPEMGSAEGERGRLYVLAEVSAPAELWDIASARIVEAATTAFRASHGGITTALNAAAEAANRLLLDENAGAPADQQIWAGLNCAVLRGGDLYLGQAGPALTYITRGNAVTRFPASHDDLQTGQREAITALGESRTVQLRLAHLTLQAGDVVALAASHLPTLAAPDEIIETLQGKQADGIADHLAELAEGQDFSALIISLEMPAVPGKPTPARRGTPTGTTPPITPAPPPRHEPPKPASAAPQPWDDEDEDEAPEAVPPPPTPAPPAQRPGAATGTNGSRQKRNRGRGEPRPKRQEDDEPPITKDEVAQDAWWYANNEPLVTEEPLPPLHTPPAPEAEGNAAGPAPRNRRPRRERQPADEGQPPDEPPAGKRRRARGSAVPADEGLAVEPIPVGGETFTARAQRRLNEGGGGDPRTAPNAAPLATTVTTTARHAAAGGASLLARFLGWLIAGVRMLRRAGEGRSGPGSGQFEQGLSKVLGIFPAIWHGIMSFAGRLLPGVQDPDNRGYQGGGSSYRPSGNAIWLGLALLLTIVISVSLAAGWQGEQATAQATAVDRNEMAELIAEVEQADNGQARELLPEVRAKLDAATEAEPNSVELQQMRQRLAAVEDRALGLTRISPTRLAAFGEAAQPVSVVHGGGRLFALELNEGAIYELDPATPLDNPITTVQPIIWSGQGIETTTLATPQFMTWTGDGTGGRLVVLTSSGQLVAFDPQARTLAALPFAPVNARVVDIGNYEANLYLLDRENRQVWKYVPQGGAYNQPPSSWMTPEAASLVGAPLSLAIDGDIYLLDSDGKAWRMNSGKVRDFSLSPIQPPLEAPAAITTHPPETTDLFVAEGERVVRFDKRGVLKAQYLPPPDNSWGAIRDLSLDTPNNVLYVLTTGGLFRLPLPNDVPPAEAAPAP